MRNIRSHAHLWIPWVPIDPMRAQHRISCATLNPMRTSGSHGHGRDLLEMEWAEAARCGLRKHVSAKAVELMAGSLGDDRLGIEDICNQILEQILEVLWDHRRWDGGEGCCKRGGWGSSGSSGSSVSAFVRGDWGVCGLAVRVVPLP